MEFTFEREKENNTPQSLSDKLLSGEYREIKTLHDRIIVEVNGEQKEIFGRAQIQNSMIVGFVPNNRKLK